MEIRSLAGVSFEELFEAFAAAFADYQMQLDSHELRAMLLRRGFDAALSFAAFEGGRIVSFTCNGIGDFDGRPTAYDTGTGTLAAYRGQGLASGVFEASIPHLRAAGIGQYLLEVLQHNTGAVSVYRKIGFEVAREFYYFRAAASEVKNDFEALDFPHEIRAIELADHPEIAAFRDFRPSWQNSLAAIGRAPESFIARGVFARGKLIGYAVFEPASGDVTQLAVEPAWRRRGVGSLLLGQMLQANLSGAIKVINTQIGCDSIVRFLAAKGLAPTGRQFEMIRKL